MIVYSIRDLEKLSGVKAHTIRMWEKRYGIIQPKRTETNIRYYLEEDLKLVLNICLLNRSGLKISKISDLKKDEIFKQAQKISDLASATDDDCLDNMTLSLLDLNESKFTRLFNANIEQRGFIETMEEVIFPLLDKLSLMWITGSIRQVHESFVGNIIKRKITTEIDKIEFDDFGQSPKFFLFLPESEDQELSLLFLHFLLRKEGFQVLNAGKELKEEEILEGCMLFKPDFIFTIINETYSSGNLQLFVDKLCTKMPQSKFILSGYQAIQQNLHLPLNCLQLNGIAEIKSFCSDLILK